VEPLSIYLDPSVIVSLFVSDSLSAKAHRILDYSGDTEVVVSDFASAEFASAIAKKARTREISVHEAQDIFYDFDEWVESDATEVNASGMDIARTIQLLRRLDTSLRTPDAVHLAMSDRLGARLLTFDKQLAQAARRYDVPLLRI
jgi:predicted nucleic acid-binding protein